MSNDQENFIAEKSAEDLCKAKTEAPKLSEEELDKVTGGVAAGMAVFLDFSEEGHNKTPRP